MKTTYSIYPKNKKLSFSDNIMRLTSSDDLKKLFEYALENSRSREFILTKQLSDDTVNGWYIIKKVLEKTTISRKDMVSFLNGKEVEIFKL